MSSRNGSTPPDDLGKRADRLTPGGGISPETTEFLERRTEGFQRALNRKGLPLTWGTGKPPQGPAKGRKA
jgi:hypothetical protein